MSKEIKAIINDLEEKRERIRTKCLYPEDVLDCEDLIKIMNYIKQLQQKIEEVLEDIKEYKEMGYSKYDENEIEIELIDKILEKLGGENNR